MTTRTITTDEHRESLILYLKDQKLPFTASITQGAKRSTEQNRLQRKWISEVSEQLGDQTPEEVRGYCKLTIGVPILRAEDANFCMRYDAVFKPLPYETKIELMQEPFDFAVTRLMSTKQKSTYLDNMARYWSNKGILLSDPSG